MSNHTELRVTALEILRSCELLKSLGEENFREATKHIELEEFVAGQTMFTKG